MMQAGDNASLRGFVAGLFDVRVGRRTHRIVSALEENGEGPLPKLRSWTNKRGMVKNPAVFVVSRQGAVDEAPEIESKLKVIPSSTPSESAKGSKRPRPHRGRLRKRPLSNANQCVIQEW